VARSSIRCIDVAGGATHVSTRRLRGSCFLPPVFLASLAFHTPLPAVLCLTIAMLGSDMTLPPSWAFCIDIGRANAGAVSGTMNMAGNIGSFVTSLAFPYLLAMTDRRRRSLSSAQY
jgi:nitrate/nitrite transporter NarK